MIIDIVKQSLMITSFVLVMMLIIEFVNVRSKGKWSVPLRKHPWLQVLIASFFGIIPGCLGTYTMVSLYTHNVIGFGALTASMISTFGDEAYVMLAIMPGVAVKLIVILFVIGVLTGFIINFFSKRKKMPVEVIHLEIHEHEIKENSFRFSSLYDNFRKISFHRALLFFAFALFIFGIISGELGSDHDHSGSLNPVTTVQNTDHSENHDHGTAEEESNHSGWDWVRVTFLVISVIAIIIISFVQDHFLQEHIWGHIIKKHFLQIFLWTLFAMALIALMNRYFHFDEWIGRNQLYILLIAVIIGIIPESGPHLVFVSMFYYGTIPFSILLANSIVQDGHGALPLFAESKKSFVKMKLINILVGMIIGLSGYFMGW